jgi:hypothetical protein
MRMNPNDYWESALALADYVDQMTLNQEWFRSNLEATELLPEERAAFVGGPLRILVLTEDFCGDSAQLIPVAGRLARELDNVEVRVLHRDQHLELADGYRRKDGYQAIPVFIVLDETGDELGSLIERPERSTQAMAAETARFAAEHADLEGVRRSYQNMPDATRKAVSENIRRWRAGQQELWTRWFLDDLAQLLPAKTQPVE